MSCLSMSCSLYITKNVSKANTNDYSSSSPQSVHLVQTNNNSLKPPLRVDKSAQATKSNPPTTTPTKKPKPKPKPKPPSIVEIERAIGAGRYRNADPRELEEEKDVEFDLETLSFPGKFEGPVQKRLQETGEWMIEHTEKKFRMSGKMILKVTFLWILPIWSILILIAAGAIKLPFSNQFIDQLIM